MPKLLQISVESNIGSTGRIAELIGNIAIKHGWESFIAYGRYARPSSSKTIRIGNWMGVLMHGLQSRLLDRHGLGSYYHTLRFIDDIKKLKPDVIHLHNIHGYYVNMEILFAFLAESKIPVIWTLHDCWPITGHCSHFDYVGCVKWKKMCDKCPQKKEYPASWFLDRSKNNYFLKKDLFLSVENLTLVPVSKWLNNILELSFMSKVSRRIIFNGVDTDLFSPQKPQIDIKRKLNIDGKYVILSLATTWNNRKGLLDFMELSKVLDPDAVIVLIGLSKSQIKKLPKNVIGLERTENQTELRDYYITADVLLSLSVEESFGLTIVEAFACGTPAIVYNSTALPELVDEKTGIVVEKGNIEAVNLAIKKIKDIGKSYYIDSCRIKAVQFYEQKNNFEEYFKLYEMLS